MSSGRIYKLLKRERIFHFNRNRYVAIGPPREIYTFWHGCSHGLEFWGSMDLRVTHAYLVFSALWISVKC